MGVPRNHITARGSEHNPFTPAPRARGALTLSGQAAEWGAGVVVEPCVAWHGGGSHFPMPGLLQARCFFSCRVPATWQRDVCLGMGMWSGSRGVSSACTVSPRQCGVCGTPCGWAGVRHHTRVMHEQKELAEGWKNDEPRPVCWHLKPKFPTAVALTHGMVWGLRASPRQAPLIMFPGPPPDFPVLF